MNTRSKGVIVALCTLLLAGVASARDGFVALTWDPTIPGTVREDINQFTVEGLRKADVMNIVATSRTLTKEINTTCVSNLVCLQQVRDSFDLDRLFVTTVVRQPKAGYMLTTYRVDKYNYRFTATKTVKTDEIKLVVTQITTAVHELITRGPPKAKLTITTTGGDTSDAMIIINDKLLGRGEWSGLLKPGKHTIKVSHSDADYVPQPFTAVVTLAPDDDTSVNAEFTSVAPTFSTKDNSGLKQGLKIGGWSSVGVGMALGSTALALQLIAVDLQKEINAACTDIGGGVIFCNADPGALKRNSDTIRSYNKAVTPLAITAGVVTTAGVGLLLWDAFTPETEQIPVQIGAGYTLDGVIHFHVTGRF